MPRQKDIYLGRHKKDWATYEQSAERVKEPHKHDVLCGRGGRVNVWPGNVAYRRVVEFNKEKCRTLSNPHKRLLARSIVDAVAQQDPPGRFLQRTKEGDWMNIGYNPAVHKTGQALRERNRDESDNESDGGQSDEERQPQTSVAAKKTKHDPTLPPIDMQRDLGGASGPATITAALPQHISTMEAQMAQVMAARPMMAAPSTMGHHQHAMNQNMSHVLSANGMHGNSALHNALPSPCGLPPGRPAESQQLARVLAASGGVRQTQQTEPQNDLAQVLAALNRSGQPLDATSLRALSAIAMFNPQGFSASSAQAALAAGAGANVGGDGGPQSFSSPPVGAQSTLNVASRPSHQQHLTPAPTTAFNAPMRHAVGENTAVAAQMSHQPIPHPATASLQRTVTEIPPGASPNFVPGHPMPQVVGPAAAISASVQAAQPNHAPTLPPRKRRELSPRHLYDQRQQQEQASGLPNSNSVRTPLEEVSDAAAGPAPRQQINAKMLRVAGQFHEAYGDNVSLTADAGGGSNHATNQSATVSSRRPPSDGSAFPTDNPTGLRRRSSALAAISARGRKRSSSQGLGVNDNSLFARSDLKRPPPSTPADYHVDKQRRRFVGPEEREMEQQQHRLSDLSDDDELSKQAESLMCLPDVEGVHDFDSLSDFNSVLDIDAARRNGLLTKLYPSDDEDDNEDARSTTSGRRYVEVMNAYCGIPLIDSEDEDVTPNLEVHAGVPLDSPCASPTPMLGDAGPSLAVTAARPALPVAFAAGMIPVGGGLQATVRASARFCIPQ